MKKYNVSIIREAETDLLEIYNYIAVNDSVSNALKVMDKLEKECSKLQYFPSRGRIVPELKRISVTSYLEILKKPFRIIFQIIQDDVFIHAVLDSRRDLEELLYERLLWA